VAHGWVPAAPGRSSGGWRDIPSVRSSRLRQPRIGRTLLAAAHDALRAAGCPEAFLFVHEQNERALAVYTAAGYRPDGSDRVSEFRGIRVREVRLVKQV